VLDFIERHFGFSPDGSDGSFEMLMLVLAVTAILALGLLWFHPHPRDATVSRSLLDGNPARLTLGFLVRGIQSFGKRLWKKLILGTN